MDEHACGLLRPALNFFNQLTKWEELMADDRERNQGMKQGTGEGTGQHAPGRNPQGDRAAGGHGDYQRGGDRQGGQKRDVGFDPSKGGDGGSYKEGKQNEQTRR